MVWQEPLATFASIHESRIVLFPNFRLIISLLSFHPTVTFSLSCDVPSRYCIEYNNGTLHDVLTFELIVIFSAILAIFGYLRAASLHRQERQNARQSEEEVDEAGNTTLLGENSDD